MYTFYVNGFHWDKSNGNHIAQHGVSEAEFEEAATDPQRVSFSAHSGNLGYIGKTAEGRVLVVILQRLAKHTWRPVTARDSSPKEKKSYRRRIK